MSTTVSNPPIESVPVRPTRIKIASPEHPRLRIVTRVGAMIVAMCLALGTALAGGSAANAAAYTQNAYAPQKVSGAVEGWAQIVQDCNSGTLGCWTYVKIERWEWLGNKWSGGGWVTGSGWQKARGTLAGGCNYYRTTVDSYNDAVGPIQGSINIGSVGGGGGGQKVYRYKSTWSSNWAYLCN